MNDKDKIFITAFKWGIPRLLWRLRLRYSCRPALHRLHVADRLHPCGHPLARDLFLYQMVIVPNHLSLLSEDSESSPGD